MTYATPQDVAVELRGSTSVSPAEEVQWQAWLDRVEHSIEARFRRQGLDLSAQASVCDPDGGTVGDVEVAAVVRKVDASKMAPGTSQTVTVDDGSVTNRNDFKPSDGYDPLAVTDSEWALLLPETYNGAFSTRPTFQPDRRW